MGDSISIEETNKIRAAIGLKPLPVPGATNSPAFKSSEKAGEDEDLGSTLESRQGQAYDNWKKVQDEAEAKAKRQAKNDAIKKARDAAQRFAALEGKGLGEADNNGDLDTKSWLLQQKKRQKKLEKARKLEQELAEREKEAEYTAKDLTGVKVAHELGDFDEGGEQILTLKDTTIDENEEEGDELEAVELREREKLAERLELKKKKPVYNPNDFDDGGEKSILGQYDEEIGGKKRKKITLNGEGRSEQDREMLGEGRSEQVKSKAISLDFLKDAAPISDYQDISEIKLRKPKKKKAKSTRQKAADDDDIFPADAQPETNGDGMEIDGNGTRNPQLISAKRKIDDTSLIDDDDLQASLALQRREALKKRKRVRPEDIARQLREEASVTPGADESLAQSVEEDQPGLILDETTEFVANLQKPSAPERQTRPRSRSKSARVTPKVESAPLSDAEGDVDMERSYDDIEDEEELQARLKRETSTPADITSTGLDNEITLNKGLGSTLAMLSQRGLIKASDSGDINALHRDRQRFLAEKQKRENEAERRARLQRERDRASGKLDRMSAREREEYARWENKQRDQVESRQMADIFNKEYKPDVELKYVDEFGRAMNQKEAFKHLSHQFHGKGSGKQKTEKRLKKIEDEKKRMAMSSLDSSQSTGMNNAMGATAKKNRQAGVRLA